MGSLHLPNLFQTQETVSLLPSIVGSSRAGCTMRQKTHTHMEMYTRYCVVTYTNTWVCLLNPEIYAGPGYSTLWETEPAWAAKWFGEATRHLPGQVLLFLGLERKRGYFPSGLDKVLGGLLRAKGASVERMISEYFLGGGR